MTAAPTSRQAAFAAALAAALTSPASARAADETEDLVSPIQGALSLREASGDEIARAEPGQAIALRLTLTNAVTGRPGDMDGARAFVRALDGEPAACAQRVRLFRATGAVASTDHRLAGSLLLSLGRDDRLALIDPQAPASRNTLAVRDAPGPDPRLHADPRRGRFYVQSGETGAVHRIRMPDLVASALAEPGLGALHIDEAGPVALGAHAMADLGDRGDTTPLPDGPWRIVSRSGAAILANPANDWLVAPSTRARLFTRFSGVSGATPLAATRDGSLLLTAQADGVAIRYAGSTRMARVALGAPAVAAWIDPEGRRALVQLDRRETVAIVDLAFAALRQAIALDAPLADVSFVDDAGFLQLETGDVLRLSLASLADGRAIELQPAAQSGLRKDAGPPPKLAALAEQDGVLAASADGAHVAQIAVMAHPALNGAPPASAPTALRTSPARAIAAAPRGFLAVAPGVYEAPLLPRAAGDHVLVVADRLGRFSLCRVFGVGAPLDAQAQAARRARLTVVAERSRLAPREISDLVLRLEAPLAMAQAAPSTALFEAMELESPWRARFVAERRADGDYVARLAFPRAGRFVLQPLAPKAGAAFARPLVVVVPAKPISDSQEDAP